MEKWEQMIVCPPKICYTIEQVVSGEGIQISLSAGDQNIDGKWRRCQYEETDRYDRNGKW